MDTQKNYESRNKHPKVLLLGNGLNRAYGVSNWSDLIAKISCDSLEEYKSNGLDNLPYPLQAIIYTHDNVNEGVDIISDWLLEENVNSELAEQLQILADIGFDAILTTNYSYEIEKALNPKFKCKKGCACKSRHSNYKGKRLEEQFGIYKYMHMETETNTNNIWHIHGEAARSNSMVLGHYYYGNLVSTIQHYIKSFIARYRGCALYKKDFVARSWIDHFMQGDVYILGLGLDSSEFDLWWLINCKKRHQQELDLGKIYWFEPNLDTKENAYKKILANDNGIKVVTETIEKEQYRDYYKKTISKIENIIHSCQ